MTHEKGSLNIHDDPREILSVELDACEEQIRAAYLSKVKEFPPDRAPAEFERIRDAYEILRDPHRRIAHLLFSVDPLADLAPLIERRQPTREFVGPDPWLAAIREK